MLILVCKNGFFIYKIYHKEGGKKYVKHCILSITKAVLHSSQ